MKRRTGMLAMVCLVAALAGCSNTSTAQETTTAVETQEESTVVQEKSETTTQAVKVENVAETTAVEAEEQSYPFQMTVYDSAGTAYEQTFEQAPERVVTTTTSAAELLIALGLEDKIVGIITPDNQVPEEIQPIFDGFVNLGDKKTLSKEVIVAADPDLVIGRVANFTEETSIDSYAELGILSYTQLAGNSAVTSSPKALLDDIRNLGAIFDVKEEADAYANELEQRLEDIKESVSERETETPLRSLMMVNLNEGVFGVMNGQLQDEIMTMLGCEDVADKGQSGLSYENLIQYNPDVIIYITADRNAATDEKAVETLLSEALLKSIPAIANEKIITVKYDCIMDVGPRMYDTIEELNTFLSTE